MTNRDIRELALLALDDGSGINLKAYQKLSDILTEIDCVDILAQVDTIDGRFYIGEDWAEDALRDLSKWEEVTKVNDEENNDN